MEDEQPTLKESIYSPESPLRKPFALVASICSDIWKSRELIWVLFLRDLKAQHRQSFLGYVWLVVPPLATALVWLLMNSQKMINVDTGDVPYPVFVLVGTTIWGAFAATLMAPSDAIYASREVFVKLNVSVEAFVLAGVGRAVFNLLVMTAILLPLLLIQGVTVHAGWLLFPIGMCMTLTMAFTIGIALAPIGALYQDVRAALGPIVGVLIFTTPVLMPIPQSDGYMHRIMHANPLTPGIQFSRDCLLTGNMDWFAAAFVHFVVATFIVFLSFICLRVAKPHIIARLGM